ncbi:MULTISPECIES: hypothetical protein [Amycolatopsis]|uniref:hypothetical protein n=1 Tax=Amycolatopsis TaxID=1813 RepID=UPI000AC99D7F|nr:MULTISPECIES: hypothetical protein [Amycolatopsis]
MLGIPVAGQSPVGFTAVIQVAAIAAVLVYFYRGIRRFAAAWGRGLVHAGSGSATATSSPGGRVDDTADRRGGAAVQTARPAEGGGRAAR